VILSELAGALRAEGGLLAATVVEPVTEAGTDLAVEAIREGELVHFGEPRVVQTQDADLAILAGDHLYALGLSQLAARGDLDAVAALADVIARCARAHAEDRPEDARIAWQAYANGQETV
jgi:hypothetical protein